MYKLMSKLSVLILFLYLFSGVCRAVFIPADINIYENRRAEQLSSLTAQSYADGSFQSSMDKALADQLPLSSLWA